MIESPHDEIIQKILSSKIIGYEFANFFLGNLVGEGCFRSVFQCAHNPKLVVKVEMDDTYENAREHEVWHRVKEVKRIAQWFAPIIQISPCNRIMLMKKTIHHIDNLKRPDKIPDFFTDIKPENFGWIGNQYVCHDYAGNLLMEKGMRLKLKKVKWY